MFLSYQQTLSTTSYQQTSTEQPLVVEPVTLVIRISVQAILNQFKLWKSTDITDLLVTKNLGHVVTIFSLITLQHITSFEDQSKMHITMSTDKISYNRSACT